MGAQTAEKLCPNHLVARGIGASVKTQYPAVGRASADMTPDSSPLLKPGFIVTDVRSLTEQKRP